MMALIPHRRRTEMTTAQLVVIWYAALFVSGIMFFLNHSHEPWYPVTAVLTLAGTIVYILRHHPNARKGWVLFWISLPFLVIGIGAGGWYGFTAYQDWADTQVISHNDVTLSNLVMYIGEKRVKKWNLSESCHSRALPQTDSDLEAFFNEVSARRKSPITGIYGCIGVMSKYVNDGTG